MNLKKISMTGLVLAMGAGAVLWSAMERKAPGSNAEKAVQTHTMEEMPAAGTLPNAGPGEVRLQPVAANLVCMVNNRVFPTPQIPVEFKGRTYYGCCEGCKKSLETNREARMAVDPVSGMDVDKALAVIGSLPDGRVYYFASAENLAAFNPASVN